MMTIGQSLRALRAKNKWTQKDLAQKAKIHQGNISVYENDKSDPSIEHLRKLANAFGVSVAVIDERLLNTAESTPNSKPHNCPIQDECPLSGDLGKDKQEILEWLFKPENRLKLRELQTEMERSKNRNGGTNGRCNEKPMAKMA